MDLKVRQRAVRETSKTRAVKMAVASSISTNTKKIPVRPTVARPSVRKPANNPQQAVKKVGVDLVKSTARSIRQNRVKQTRTVTKKKQYAPQNIKQRTRPISKSITRRRTYVDKSPPKKPRTKIDVRFSKYSTKIENIRDIGKGRVLIMIACGPSVKESPLELLADHHLIDFMVINQPYGYYPSRCPEGHEKIWPAKYWAFCDHSQYKRNLEAWNKYKGFIINSSAVRATHPKQIIVKNRGGKGFSKDLAQGYHIGRSSTYANMQTAWHLGYDKIYIFGLDMGEVGGKLHHYGENPDIQSVNRIARFSLEATTYSFAVTKLSAKERSRFVLCSTYNKWPFVEHFENLDQKEAPRIILERLGGVKNIEKQE